MPDVIVSPSATEVRFVSYKAYTALLNQAGTDTIVPIVYDNSVSGVWTRRNAGSYFFTFDTPIAKAKLFMAGFSSWESGSSTIAVPLTNEGGITGYVVVYCNFVQPAFEFIDGLYLDCNTGDFGQTVDLGTLVANFPIEIRQYA